MTIRKFALAAVLMTSLLAFSMPQSYACNSGKCKCLLNSITAEKACSKCGKENCKCGCEGDPAKCTCSQKKGTQKGSSSN